MVRVVNEKEHAERRSEILNAAYKLIYTRGYEQMSIQDILDEQKISKGAFYHYFDSKQALLEAVIDRMIQEGLRLIQPIVQDPALLALEKFRIYFQTAGRWKTGQKEFLLALLRAWYRDENLVVRQKLISRGYEQIAPVLSLIIHQGVGEGVMNNPYPDQASEVAYALMMGLGDNMARYLLSDEPRETIEEKVLVSLAAYTDALERVLGAPAGSLQLMDEETLREWVVPAGVEA
jgi:TetR/AcrR family transcriptional regulator, transcriptional repressor for nem operon